MIVELYAQVGKSETPVLVRTLEVQGNSKRLPREYRVKSHPTELPGDLFALIYAHSDRYSDPLF